MYYCQGKIGTPIDFSITKKEAPLFVVIRSLVNYKPKEINPILFDNLNSDYMNQCYWILKWNIESWNNNLFIEQDYLCDNPMVKACIERSRFMECRLYLCHKLFSLFNFSSYRDFWHFWLKVEIEWKKTLFEITNKDAELGISTKQNINSANLRFIQLLKNKKNPYQSSVNPHLFTMIDTSLKIINFQSKQFSTDISKDFLINFWNPLIKRIIKWFKLEKEGFALNNNKLLKFVPLNLSADEKTLITTIRGRKKEAVYQQPQINFSGRGRKKEEKKYDATDFLSLTIPKDFGDLSYLEI